MSEWRAIQNRRVTRTGPLRGDTRRSSLLIGSRQTQWRHAKQDTLSRKGRIM